MTEDDCGHGWHFGGPCMNYQPDQASVMAKLARGGALFASDEMAVMVDAYRALEAERDALKAERDELADQHYGKMRRALTNRAEHAEAQGAALRVVVERYVKHPASCPKGIGIGYYQPATNAVCNCGIDAALLTAPPQTEPQPTRPDKNP